MRWLVTRLAWTGLVLCLPVPSYARQAPFKHESDCERYASGRGAVTSDDVVDAMRRGWWPCAEALATRAAEAGAADLENLVAVESRVISKHLSGLKSVLQAGTPQLISPAFQWAQSGDTLFLNVKFSHKIDAPATLDVVVDSVNVTNSSLTLAAAKDRKAFSLSLSFFGPVDPDASSWTTASVGRVVFTLRKAGAPSAWPKLLGEGARKPQNMHLWWDKQEEFQDEIDDLEDGGDGGGKVGGSKDQGGKKKATGEKKKSKKQTDKKRSKKKGGGTRTNSPTSTASGDTTRSTSPSLAAEGGGLGRVGRMADGAAQTTAEIQVDVGAAQRLKDVDEEAAKRKKEIDDDARRRKAEIDKETEAKKKEIREDSAKEKARLREGELTGDPAAPAIDSSAGEL